MWYQLWPYACLYLYVICRSSKMVGWIKLVFLLLQFVADLLYNLFLQLYAADKISTGSTLCGPSEITELHVLTCNNWLWNSCSCLKQKILSFPDFSQTIFQFLDFSGFSRWVVTPLLAWKLPSTNPTLCCKEIWVSSKTRVLCPKLGSYPHQEAVRVKVLDPDH